MEIQLKNKVIRKDYCKVTFHMDGDSVYSDSENIKVKIKYGRMFDGKFQQGIIKGRFLVCTLFDVIWFIKRGFDTETINNYIELFGRVKK